MKTKLGSDKTQKSTHQSLTKPFGKKFMSFVLCICMLTAMLSAMPINAFAATSGTCGDNLTWTLDDEGTLIISGTGDMWDWSWNNELWYNTRESIKTVIIQNGVTSIGDSVFGYCRSLTSVTIPNSVTSIGNSAFYDCESLTSINIPNGVTSIGEYAFGDCKSLASITISNSVTFIGDNAFLWCNKLTDINIDEENPYFYSKDGLIIKKSNNELIAIAGALSGKIIIPEGVKNLKKRVFSYNENITSISIPASLTNLNTENPNYPEEVLFAGCTNLTSVEVDQKNPIYSSYNNVIYDKNKTKLIRCSEGYSGDVVIPNTVKSIDAWAFAYCKKVNSINVPNTVDNIGEYAFCGCRKITKINIPSKLTSISNGLFDNCKGLTNVVLPKGINSIGKNAFYYCSSLERIDLPMGLKTIGDSAFYDCSFLKELIIPEGVTSIGYYACCGCTSLEKITLPKSLTRIGGKQFGDCKNLKYISYGGTMADWDRLYENGEGQYGLPDGCVVQCSDGSYYDDYAPITGITLSTPTNTIFVGSKVRIIATCTPYSATYKRIVWSSSNNAVATVDANGYVTGKSAGTATITARTSNGLTASCNVNVSSSTIQNTSGSVLNYNKFRYSFGNNANSFGYSSDYRIPVERYRQTGLAPAVSNVLYLTNKWGGSCFGMSASSILFFSANLTEEKYNSSVHFPNDFGAPNSNSKTDTKLREMIELLHVSQWVSDFDLIGISTNRYEELRFNATYIKNELDKRKPVLFNLSNPGHAVVIYGYTQNNSSISFKIYDCSGFVSEYTNEGGTWHFKYNNPKYSFTVRGFIPYDEVSAVYWCLKNSNKQGAASLLSSNEKQEYTYIIHPTEDMTITNSAGQISQITDGEIDGDIENISVIPDSYLIENPKYTIIAPKDTYTIIGTDNEEVETIIADDNMSVAINSISSVPLTISSNLHNISVQNSEQADYSIKYTVYDNVFDEMTLSGTTNGAIRTSLNNSDITVSGAESISAEATVSERAIDVLAENLQSDEAVVTVKNEENATVQIISVNQSLTAAEELPSREQLISPDYDLESGEYSEAQMLTFTKGDDTLIYYTTDGSAPNENSLLYTAPININKSMTITAIAKKYGYIDSEPIILEYTLPEILPPVSSVESGTYDTIQSVALTSDEDCQIYYTTDGSDPIGNEIEYNCEINIAEDTVLKAVAIKDGCVSDVAEYDYSIEHKYPLTVINSPTDQDGNIITSNTINDVSKINLVLQKFDTGNIEPEFIVACYDDNNRMIGICSDKQMCDESINVIELQMPECENIKTVKVLCWDSLNGMKPLSEICVIE